MTLRGFPPVATPEAGLLILGSMPGKASFAAGQYYAHTRNLFWKILGELLGAGPELPYDARLDVLREQGVALWDVIAECERKSALDNDIVEASIVVNDFAMFFAQHPGIRRVYFNGTKAEQAFRKYVRPRLPHHLQLACIRLPSTSPANASIPAADKLQAWRRIVTD